MLDTDSQNIETTETSMTHAFAKAGYTMPGIDPYDVDVAEPRHYSSPTAAICDHAALHGATPGPDEIDNRFVWDEDEAIAGIEQTVHTLTRWCAARTGPRTGRPRRSGGTTSC